MGILRGSTHRTPTPTPSASAAKAPALQRPGAKVSFVFDEEERGVDEQALGAMPLYPSTHTTPVTNPPVDGVEMTLEQAVKNMHQDLTQGSGEHGSSGVDMGHGEDSGRHTQQRASPEQVREVREVSTVANRLASTRMIHAYRDRFGDMMSDPLIKQIKSLDAKSDEELDGLLTEVKYAVFSRTQPAILKETYFALIEANETLFGARGLHDRLRKDDHIQDLLDEVNIKYQHYMYVEPEYRLIYCTLAAGAVVRRMNAHGVTLSTPPRGDGGGVDARVPVDVVQRYADL